MIDTPCQQVCRLNPHGVCTGCGRSVEEITAWRHLSVADKQAVNELAKIRLKTIVERKKNADDSW